MSNQLMQEQSYNYYLKSDIGRYIGEWLAISEDKIIAHGKNVKEVAESAEKIIGKKKFILVRVPDKEAMIF